MTSPAYFPSFQVDGWRRESFYSFDWLMTGFGVLELTYFDLDTLLKAIAEILLQLTNAGIACLDSDPKFPQQMNDSYLLAFLDIVASGSINDIRLR
jgi:hypothetical protein